MGRQANVDRQHPQLLEHAENPRLGRNGQREQHQIDTCAARKLDDIVDLAELGNARTAIHDAVVMAIVEHAEHIDVGIVLGFERLHELLAILVRANDDGAAIEPALARPLAHERTQDRAARPSAPPDQRKRTTRARHAKFRRPCSTKKDAPMNSRNASVQDDVSRRQLAKLPSEDLDIVDFGGLEAHHGGCCYAEDRREKFPVRIRSRGTAYAK